MATLAQRLWLPSVKEVFAKPPKIVADMLFKFLNSCFCSFAIWVAVLIEVGKIECVRFKMSQ